MISQISVMKNDVWEGVNVTEEEFKEIMDVTLSAVGDGAIHTFSSITNARKDRGWHRSWHREFDYIIYKCIIPKGTLYYEGTFNGDMRAFASNKLIFKEEVK